MIYCVSNRNFRSINDLGNYVRKEWRKNVDRKVSSLQRIRRWLHLCVCLKIRSSEWFARLLMRGRALVLC